MQQQKVTMGKRQFRIGDLAKELHVKKFVIRFWEREFDLKSDRSQGGQRFYTDDDLKTFQTIKHLLYEQGFTIAGAKKHLQPALNGELIAPPATPVTMPLEAVQADASSEDECDTGEEITSTDFMPCTHDVQPVQEIKDGDVLEADASSIVPATTMYEHSEINDQKIDDHMSEAMIQARVREEVVQTLAPIKEKLLQLKAMLD